MNRFTAVALLLASLLTAGCGRFGFESGPPGTDAAVPDALADTGSNDSAPLDGSPASCAELFTDLPDDNDQICDVSATVFCRVAVTLKQQASCDQFCSQHGTTCLGVMSNGGTAYCTASGFDTCDNSDSFSSICNCALPGAPPAQTCVDRFPDALVCGTSGSTCTVAAPLFGKSCTEYCEARGYTCQTAQLKSGKELCTPVSNSTCDAPQDHTAICTCAP